MNRNNNYRYDNGGHASSSNGSSNGSHRNVIGHVVAQHYNSRPELGRDRREDSLILHLKNFNNWVKAQLISRYCPSRSLVPAATSTLQSATTTTTAAADTGSHRDSSTGHSAANSGAYVLDMCCGKGGDLQKWRRAQIADLVGIDVAAVSVEQARMRYIQGCSRSFSASFYAADCFANLDSILNDRLFDLVSCQFSLHYSFESEQTARQAIINVSSHLVSGGYFIGTLPNADWIYKRLLHTNGLSFGNPLYSITFETKTPSKFGHKYRFNLADAIDDCPEYLIHITVLTSIAAEYGLELIYYKPFHEFYQDHCIEGYEALERMRVFNSQGTISPDEWEAAGIYSAFVFRKT
eukprot:jgi/Hompol1/4482/HPOL_003649-RA